VSQFGFARPTFARLPALAGEVLAGGAVEVAWPLLTALATAAALVALAVVRFGRREI
jgi:hypothetical protein